jgi:RNA polymerase sigma-70 factor (ECF subfamily)
MNKIEINHLWNQITGHDDQQAFKRLYDLMFMDLFRWALSLTKSKETSEEIVHDTLMVFWNKRKEMAGVENPRIYLLVTLKNKCLDFLRKASKISVEHIADIQHFDITVKTDPEKLLITAEMIAQVEHSIQQLPPRTKAVFMMVKQYGLKYKEVAELLNVSPRTVENQLALAIRRISQSITFLLDTP